MHIRVLGHYWQTSLLLLCLAESLAVGASCDFACRYHAATSGSLACWVQSLALVAAMLTAMTSMGLYTPRLRDRFAGVVLRLMLSVGAVIVLAAAVVAVAPGALMGAGQLAFALLSVWCLVFALRMAEHRFVGEDAFKRRIVLYGAGTNAARILALRRRADQRGFRLMGFIPVQSEPIAVPEDRLLDASSGLRELIDRLEVDEIVVAMNDRRLRFPLKELLDCRLQGTDITDMVTFLERETGKVHLDFLNPGWLIFGEGFRRGIGRRMSERAFDLLVSFVMLVLATPVMLLTALAIKIEDGWRAPVLYVQPRVGLGGSIFRIIKFRSMTVNAEREGKAVWATADDARITRVGSVIRKFRIDELPQLLNVLRGEMRFVGPRPERPEFVAGLAESVPYYQERHTAKPGLTGWAQLCYPYGASEDDAAEKLQYDLYYVKNHSLIFDVLILLQTVEIIVLRKGAR